MNFDRNLFSTTLKSYLMQHHLTMREAARVSGVSVSTMSRLVNGEAPDIDSFATIVRWMGEDANRFLENLPRINEKDEAWIAFCVGLLELGVPDDLADAIATVVRLVIKKKDGMTNRP